MASSEVVAAHLMTVMKHLEDQNKETKELRKRKTELEIQLLDLMETEDIEELEMTNGTRILLSNKLVLEKKTKGKRRRAS